MPFWSKAGRKPVAAPELKASAAATGHAMWRTSADPWPRWSYKSAAERALCRNPVAQRCLRLITDSAAAVAWKLHDRHAVLEDDPLLAIIQRPNPLCSRSGLIEAVISHLLLHGNAYIEKVVAEDGVRPLELYALRPDRMSIKPGVHGWPQRYEYTSGDQKVSFPVDTVSGESRILHLKTHNPLDDYYGQSALQAALSALDLHGADMDFQATIQGAARDIALAVGAPPMLLGIPGDNTYANYQEANKALWRQTIMPLLRKLLDALNIWLIKPVQQEYVLRLDEMTIPALAEDRDAHWRRVASSDFLTPDEKRALLNLAPLEQPVSKSGTSTENEPQT